MCDSLPEPVNALPRHGRDGRTIGRPALERPGQQIFDHPILVARRDEPLHHHGSRPSSFDAGVVPENAEHDDEVDYGARFGPCAQTTPRS